MKIREILEGKRRWAVLAAAGLLILLIVSSLLPPQSKSPEVRDNPAPSAQSPSGGTVSDNARTLTPSTPEKSLLSAKTENENSFAPGGSTDQITVTSLPPLGNRVIKNAALTVKVRRRGFDRAYDRAVLIAKANGGYVVGSSSSVDSGPVAGNLTVRIPAGSFEKTLTELRRLGKVRAQNVSGQDVSQEFVDLESRLRHWRAQETILLGLMEKAQSISDSIAVQNQLSAIEQQIEEITGRLNFLKDQTQLSTIQLTIAEGTIAPLPTDRWGFKEALSRAAHAFVDTINGTIILLGYLLPLGLLGAVIYMIAMLLRKKLSGATGV